METWTCSGPVNVGTWSGGVTVSSMLAVAEPGVVFWSHSSQTHGTWTQPPPMFSEQPVGGLEDGGGGGAHIASPPPAPPEPSPAPPAPAAPLAPPPPVVALVLDDVGPADTAPE